LTDADIDMHLNAVLRAAGSDLKHYSLPLALDKMRSAMGTAMRHLTATHGETKA
jgi:hypothetical protein